MSNSPSQELPAPSTEAAAPPPQTIVNSTDATAGRPLVARVTERKQELETLLAALAADDNHAKQDIEAALAAVETLLSGDLEHVPPVVMVDLNRWLERSKHLGERNGAAAVVAEPVVTGPVAAPAE
jgi:hypothetical protein